MSSFVPPRSQTLSPPPQFASPATTPLKSALRKAVASNQRNLPDSSTNASSIFYSNLDEEDNNGTPTNSNRASPELRTSSAKVPAVLVEDMTTDTGAMARIQPRNSNNPAQRLPGGSGEEQVYGCLGYGGPLSHIKLPYSTPVLQRFQQTSTEALNVPGGGRTPKMSTTHNSGSTCSSHSPSSSLLQHPANPEGEHHRACRSLWSRVIFYREISPPLLKETFAFFHHSCLM